MKVFIIKKLLTILEGLSMIFDGFFQVVSLGFINPCTHLKTMKLYLDYCEKIESEYDN